MHLSELNIYPVKSLKGVSLSESFVEGRGLRRDRRWLLVDNTNRFLTQREHPIMARIEIDIDGDKIRVSFEGREIEIPQVPATDEYHTVKIWNSTVRSQFYPAETDRWFSDILGVDCRLVTMPEGAHRAVSPFYAVRRFKDEVSFADGYPFMMTGEATLADLNSRLAEPVPMNRFRPNFVVSGSDAFAEDNWRTIKIGATIFHVVKPCARCQIPTIDQDRGEFDGKEPSRTLASFRMAKQVHPDKYESLGLNPNSVLFGENLIPENPGGAIAVGDPVEVLKFRN